MLQLVRDTRPDAYPLAKPWMGAAALESAWPALIAYPRGKILAANQLLRWVSALPSPDALLGHKVLDLSAWILGSQRAPMACNAEFLLQKLGYINRLREPRRTAEMANFAKVYNAALTAAGAAVDVSSCVLPHATREFDERSPWRYPLRIAGVGDDGRHFLLPFVVTEALLPRSHFLIMLEPDGEEARQFIAEVYEERRRHFGREDYVIGREKLVDTRLPDYYTQNDIRKPEIAITYLNNMRRPESFYPIDISSREDSSEGQGAPPASVGVPVFEFRPRQSFSPQDVARICDVIDAEPAALPMHPELGRGTSFRLKAAAGLGRVQQVDIYLDRPATRGAAVRVHRLDHFGEPQAPRYRFDAGFVEEGVVPALVFRATSEGQEREITVHRDGRLGESSDIGERTPQTLTEMSESHPQPFLPLIVDAKEAAELLGVSRTAVFSAIERGRLPASKVDGRWEIRRADLDAYQQSTAHRRGKPGPRRKRSAAA